jgi:hypothetical protein
VLRKIILTCIACLIAGCVLEGQAGGTAKAGQPPAVRNSAHPGFVGDTLEVVPLTTVQAMERADRVVYVQSTGSEVKRGIGGNIFTYTSFRVMRSIKGKAGTEIKLRLLGGRIDNEIIIGPLNLDFTPGDRFVLFLGKENAEGYPTVIPQAIYAVKMQDGVQVVAPTPTGLQFYHARSGTAYSGRPTHAPLEDFIFSLEHAR